MVEVQMDTATVGGYIDSLMRRFSAKDSVAFNLLKILRTRIRFKNIDEFLSEVEKNWPIPNKDDRKNQNVISWYQIVGECSLTPATWLQKLAGSESAILKTAVARNIKTPRFILLMLSTDQNQGVSSIARQQIVNVTTVEELKKILVERLGTSVHEDTLTGFSEDLVSGKIIREASFRATNAVKDSVQMRKGEENVTVPTPADFATTTPDAESEVKEELSPQEKMKRPLYGVAARPIQWIAKDEITDDMIEKTVQPEKIDDDALDF